MVDIQNIINIIANKGYSVDLKEVSKNGEIKKGICITPPDSNIAPVIYYQAVIDDNPGATDEELAEILFDIAQKNFVQDNFDASFLMEWESVKPYIRLCVRSSTWRSNDPIAIHKPHYDWENYFRIIVPNPTGETGTIATVAVTREIFNHWDVNMSEVYDVALANSHKEFTATSMLDQLITMFGSDIPEELKEAAETDAEANMIVLSNTANLHGGSVINDFEFLAQVSEKYFNGGDFYVLPSSIHEVLATMAPENNANALREMVREVNDTQVADNERLSYSVFYFDADRKTLICAAGGER